MQSELDIGSIGEEEKLDDEHNVRRQRPCEKNLVQSSSLITWLDNEDQQWEHNQGNTDWASFILLCYHSSNQLEIWIWSRVTMRYHWQTFHPPWHQDRQDEDCLSDLARFMPSLDDDAITGHLSLGHKYAFYEAAHLIM